MKQNKYRLIEKECLNESGRIWKLRFEAPGIEAAPGQFVNVAVAGKYLRRPISVSEYDGEILSLIVQIAGEGTLRLAATPRGASLDMLTGLGAGFSFPDIAGVALIIGGGVGYAPLVGLMKKMARESDLLPFAVFGFNSREDVPLGHISELRDEGCPVEYCTMLGDMGDRGNAVEVAREHIDELGVTPVYFYTCGPVPMMEAAAREFPVEGQLSLESRMGCGFGACMGCSIKTVNGNKRICKEGPVFLKSELF